MKVIYSRCLGLDEAEIKLAECLAENALDREQLFEWAKLIWPQLSVYRGHTHWRFFPKGQECDGPSFYLELFCHASKCTTR
jgi:hypothetical protein